MFYAISNLHGNKSKFDLMLKLINFKPLEYSYAISCGRLSEIRSSISQLVTDNVIDNDALKAYSRNK